MGFRQQRGVLQIADFGQGITDHFIPGTEGSFKTGDNLYITDNKRLRGRKGSVVFDVGNSNGQVTTARIDHLFNYDRDTILLAQTGRNIYERDPGWTALIGPVDSNPALGAYSDPSITSSSEWRDHLFVTNDAGSQVVKIYRDDVGTTRVRNAGLPKLPTTTPTGLQTLAEDMANDIKLNMNAHFADAGIPASKHENGAQAAVATADATDLATLISLTNDLVTAFDEHIIDAQKVILPAFHFHAAGFNNADEQGLNRRMDSRDTATDLDSSIDRLNDLNQKYYWHDWAIKTHENPGINAPFVRLGTDEPTKGFILRIDTPRVTDKFEHLYDIAERLLGIYEDHVTDVVNDRHPTNDLRNIPISYGLKQPPTDFRGDDTELINTISHIRHNYDRHEINTDALHVGADADTEPNMTPPLGAQGATMAAWIVLLYEVDVKLQEHTRLVGGAHHNLSPILSATHPSYFQRATVADYVYSFHYEYEYMVGDVTHIDQGPITLLDAVEANIPAIDEPLTTKDDGVTPLARDSNQALRFPLPVTGKGIEITNLPTLANGSTDNWDTSIITVELFRTEDDGTVFFKLGDVVNGTATFTDRVNDTKDDGGTLALIRGEKIYTTGGVLENGAMPTKCNYLHIVDSVGYYVGVEVDGETLLYRLQTSIPGDPDSTPPDFFDDYEDDLNGVSSAGRNIVVFSENSIWRITGRGFNLLGQGELGHERISDETGLAAPGGIFRLDGKIYFPGTDGFYVTNGISIRKLSLGLDESYRALVSTNDQKKRVRVGYDPELRKIWWTMQSTSAAGEVDICWIYNENTGKFTIYSNGTNWAPTGIVYFEGQVIRGDSRGYLFAHGSPALTDPRVDVALTPDNWGEVHVPWDFVSMATDYGNNQVRKSVTGFALTAQDLGELSLDMNSISDNGRNSFAIDPILYRDNDGIVDETRKMPSGSHRCDYKQVQIKNAFTSIQKSDVEGTADKTVTVAGKFTITLNPIGVAKWDLKPHGYQIFFEFDNFTQGFEIDSRTSDTVIVALDPGSDNPGATSAKKWIIKGFPKDEELELISYNTTFTLLGISQDDFEGVKNEGAGVNA